MRATSRAPRAAGGCPGAPACPPLRCATSSRKVLEVARPKCRDVASTCDGMPCSLQRVSQDAGVGPSCQRDRRKRVGNAEQRLECARHAALAGSAGEHERSVDIEQHELLSHRLTAELGASCCPDLQFFLHRDWEAPYEAGYRSGAGGGRGGGHFADGTVPHDAGPRGDVDDAGGGSHGRPSPARASLVRRRSRK